VLVDGFLQLIRTAAEQRVAAQLAAAATPAPPASPIPPPPAPAPPVSARGPATARAAAAAPAAPPVEPYIYSIEDKDVIPPMPVDQTMPAMPPDIRLLIKGTRTTGIIDLVIDEAGRVVDATLRQSLNAGFDPVMLRSVRRWKYTPATKDGTPVRFLKTVAIVP
jgi:TonB-like protein